MKYLPRQVKLVMFVMTSLLLIFYLASKVYIYNKARNQFFELRKQLSLFVDLDYDGIASNLLEGSVSYENIRLLPVDTVDTLTIRRITLRGPGYRFFFSEPETWFQSIPNVLSLRVEGLKIRLDSELFQAFSKKTWNDLRQKGLAVPACDFGGSVFATDLGVLGFEDLEFAFSASLYRHEQAGKISFSMDTSLLHMAEFSLDMSLKSHDSSIMTVMSTPKVTDLTLTYRLDSDYMKSVQSLCGDLTGHGGDAYLESLLNATDRDYQRFYGFTPGSETRQAIARFLLQSPHEMIVGLKPTIPLVPGFLRQYKNDQLVDVLGVSLEVNGEPVENLDIRFNPDIFSADWRLPGLDSETQRLDSNGTESSDTKTTARKKLSRAVYAYQDTDVGLLEKYIGADARIHTDTGQVRSGNLIALKRGVVAIEQRVHKGKIVVHVPVGQISKLEVYRLVR